MCSFPVPRNKAPSSERECLCPGTASIRKDSSQERETYEKIMNPRDFGWGLTELPLYQAQRTCAVAAR